MIYEGISGFPDVISTRLLCQNESCHATLGALNFPPLVIGADGKVIGDGGWVTLGCQRCGCVAIFRRTRDGITAAVLGYSSKHVVRPVADVSATRTRQR